MVIKTAAVAVVGGIVLSACGGSSATPTPAVIVSTAAPSPTTIVMSPVPTPTAVPTPPSMSTPAATGTSGPLVAPTTTVLPLVTPAATGTALAPPGTQTAVPATTSTAATTPAPGYTLYRSTAGGYSIEYPSDWTRNGGDQLLQVQPRAQDALVQISYQDIGYAATPAQLEQIADTALRGGFGSAYVKGETRTQPDGSIGIDFRLNQTPEWHGNAFVEQRGTVLYMSVFLVETAKQAQYAEQLAHTLASYKIER